MTEAVLEIALGCDRPCNGNYDGGYEADRNYDILW